MQFLAIESQCFRTKVRDKKTYCKACWFWNSPSGSVGKFGQSLQSKLHVIISYTFTRLSLSSNKCNTGSAPPFFTHLTWPSLQHVKELFIHLLTSKRELTLFKPPVDQYESNKIIISVYHRHFLHPHYMIL